MATKYYISTLEEEDVKAYCIMSEEGFVMECGQMSDNNKFYEDVRILSKYYNCIKIEELASKGKEAADKINSRKYGTIPNISVSIGNYIKTDIGKKAVLDYVNSVDGFNYDLIKELINLQCDKNK